MKFEISQIAIESVKSSDKEIKKKEGKRFSAGAVRLLRVKSPQ